MRDFQTKANVGAVADSISATRFGAGEFNALATELENAVDSSDQTLAPADGTGEVDNQLAMAMAIYGAGGAAFHLDTGAVNAYVLNPVSPKESPPAYFNGFTVTFVPGTANSGASTVNVASIGVKSITMEDGTAVPAGFIDGATTIKYSSSNDRFELSGNAIGTMSVTIIAASGAYTPPPNVRALEFIAVGGGGGGGGVDGQGGGTAGASVAGGGGGTSIDYTSIIESSYTIVIGSGGSGGAAGNNPGSNGGTTTVSSTNINLTANGGNGGGGSLGGAGYGLNGGAAGGVASGGALNFYGSYSTYISLNGGLAYTLSHPGSSIFGGGYRTEVGVAGNTAHNYGEGGRGVLNYTSTTDYAGGTGADGVVIVKEYF